MSDEMETCPDCHAAVFTKDLKAHQAWHDRLARVARDADYAASMTRPIG